MKKHIIFIIGLIIVFSLFACTAPSNTSNKSNKKEQDTSVDNLQDNENAIIAKEEDEKANMKLILKIDNTEVDVIWADNDSVKALKELAKDGLTINMSKYGGFEQVGSIGSTLPSSDIRITTNPGDIVLYSSNQIVIFYDSNTWSYTKLGHINLSKGELNDLLGDEDVVITLNLK